VAQVLLLAMPLEGQLDQPVEQLRVGHPARLEQLGVDARLGEPGDRVDLVDEHAIRAALERGGVGPDQIDYVIMGQVLTAGAGQNPARIAAVGAGIPMSVPAITVNKVCLSGIDAIVLADQLLRAGDYDIVVAGGMESMSLAPHLLPSGFGYGDIMVHDSLERDGLWDYFTNQSMGALTDVTNAAGSGASREEQDTFAAESHLKAAKAWKDGLFDDEVVPVTMPQRRGDPLVVSKDEGIRVDASPASLAGLRPSFRPDGTITAGSSSPLSDGAAAVVITSRHTAQRLGLTWLAQIGSHASVAGPDSTLQLQPARAVAAACAKSGLAPTDLDLLEINEAFAAVGIVSTRQLGVDPARVNIDGGAIALGHPLGSTGARLITTLLHELERSDKEIGLVTMCCGGGLGTGTLIQRV